MTWNNNLWTRCTLLTLLLTVPLSKCDTSVHISSTYKTPVTSNTLNWLPIGHYEDSKERNLVIGGYQISKSTDDSYNEGPSEQREMFVCRASQDGVWVAGAQLKGEKSCTVTSLGNIQSQESYELLENVDSAALLSWVSWDKFQPIPTGTVVIADSMYAARHIGTLDETDKDTSTPTYTQYIGTLDLNENLGTISYVKSNGEQGATHKGELLVETEPIYYELTSVKLNWRKNIIKSDPIIIGQAKITNSRNERAKLAEAFGYKYKYLSYWGQGHAMIKALNTSITLLNRTKLPTIKWGMQDRSEREDSYSVEIDLEPGTGVNVTVKANYTEYEVSYSGQLVSHFKNGETKAREIHGVRKEQTMTDLRHEFGPIYFLSNLSFVPTTVAPTTTRGTPRTFVPSSGSSSSTSATSSTTNGQTDSNNIEENGVDDNRIVPKSDSSMQVDDGGPQSLKNKEGATGEATNVLSSLFVSLASILLTLYRIT